FDGQRLMIDVALNVALRLQHHAATADRAHDLTAHHDLVCNNAARNTGPLTDDDMGSVYVPLNVAVNLDLTLGTEIPLDCQVRADDGRRPTVSDPVARCGSRGHGGQKLVAGTRWSGWLWRFGLWLLEI